MTRYDLAVIGGGSAGMTAALIGARVGARTILIEKQKLGGDCLHYGCVPSKALLHCAKVAHSARTAERYGVVTSPPKTDLAAVMRYVWDTIAAIGANESADHFRAAGVEVCFGNPRFVSPHRLLVDGADGTAPQAIEADKIVIAVGSHALAPPIEGLEETGYLNHVSLFHLQHLPSRLVVIGGGPIGCEMGQALARLGSDVTILQSGPRVLQHDDAELSELLATELSKELTLRLNAKVVRVERDAAENHVVFEAQGQTTRLATDEILVAVGRRPNTASLDLDQAGVKTNGRGVIVDGSLRSSVAHIFAAGDCAGGFQFTHVAEAQARVAARNALFRGSATFDAVVPWTTFTDPELSKVGCSESEAQKQVRDLRVYRYPYSKLDRAQCDGAGHGLAKIFCAPNGRILGATILGPHSGEAINELTLAIESGIPLNRVAQTIHVYPTLGRIIRRLGDERFFAEGISPLALKLFSRF